MSLRFIFGRAGTGKSRICLEEIETEIVKAPLGTPLLLLVPEQATHQLEVELVNTPGLGGILRAQVLSFKRLAWKVFSETGGGNKVIIGETGKSMLIRRLLLQHRHELRILGRSAGRPGTAEQVAKAISEFKMYNIHAKDLTNCQGIDEVLDNKLLDLALLYQSFENSLGDNIKDPDDELTILAEKIKSSPTISGARVWVDGFKGFTPQEISVLKSILQIAEEVSVTLPLDPNAIQGLDSSYEASLGEEFFFTAWDTFQELRRLAVETGTLLSPPVFLSKVRRYENGYLEHLEKSFFYYPTIKLSDRKAKSGLTLYSAVNRKTEIDGIAREIRRLAREEGLRWNEMALMGRDLQGYDHLIPKIFSAYDVPFFIDVKRPILNHPLIEFLLSAIEIVTTNWGYDPLFRCLKTDFFPLKRDAIDKLENYCLSYGIKGKNWVNEEEWLYHTQWSLENDENQELVEQITQREINDTKNKIKDLFLPFYKTVLPNNINKQLTVRDITEALYSLLVNLKLPNQLQLLAEKARAEGNLSEAILQEQIWESVVKVLDEMVAGLGNECLELHEYILVLQSGLENIKVGLIPPGQDQVLIGSLERSRNPEVKVLFLLGANEGVLPARPGIEGVLDSEDRQKLEEAGLVLAPKGKHQIYEEQFFIYWGLTRSSEKLYITYPLADEEGKSLAASPVINRIKALFEEVNEGVWGITAEEEVNFISHDTPLMQIYAGKLQELRNGKTLTPMWQAVEKWFELNPEKAAQLEFIKRGLTKENQEKKIPEFLARRMFGKPLYASISRLEQFTRCPFSHFARYGLNLHERQKFELTRPNMGEFFHALLRDFALSLKETDKDWKTITKQESWEILKDLVEKIAPRLQNKVLLSNSRYQYLKYKLKRTVHQTIHVLAEHARHGTFVPIQIEVGFGPGEQLPGVKIPLQNDDMLVLRGKIDRVDGALIDGKIYLRIIDYKSRETTLKLDTIFHGLTLQLLTYLNVVLNGAEIILSNKDTLELLKKTGRTEDKEIIPGAIDKVPAGFLYFPVIEPSLQEDCPPNEEELERLRLKAFKVGGYLLADSKVLQAMDNNINSGYSDLLGIKINKDNSFRKGSNVLSEEHFEALGLFLHKFLKRTGLQIMSGDISISPYRRGKETGCNFCSYKPLCRFDPSLPENKYRLIPVLPHEEVLTRIKEEANLAEIKNVDLNWLGE